MKAASPARRAALHLGQGSFPTTTLDAIKACRLHVLPPYQRKLGMGEVVLHRSTWGKVWWQTAGGVRQRLGAGHSSPTASRYSMMLPLVRSVASWHPAGTEHAPRWRSCRSCRTAGGKLRSLRGRWTRWAVRSFKAIHCCRCLRSRARAATTRHSRLPFIRPMDSQQMSPTKDGMPQSVGPEQRR